MTRPTTNTRRFAAFFDIDGTLFAKPSLECRVFNALRHRGAIPTRNYFRWLAHSFRLAPLGMQTILHANKMYLHGVAALSSTGAYTEQPRASANVTRVASEFARALQNFRFLSTALDQAAWHAASSHAIILVSGTLAPLAHQVALALTLRLAARNFPAQIGVCATRLEIVNHRYTGRIAGEAMFGKAKAQAVRRIAAEQNFDLRRCYAYGDAWHDRWMLSTVGRPAAVNPSKELERVARLNDWPVLRWASKAESQAPPAENEATQLRHPSPHESVASATTQSHPTTETLL
jgi:HAD superfamily hydrolase (TIGR01490 family)